jgi:uncharacterized protein (TIGR00297 family)
MNEHMFVPYIIGLLLSLSVAFVAYKKRSLTVSGFITASIVGMLFYVFGTFIAWSILIFFFISSSIISKFNKNEKEKYGRDYIQVISNSIVSLFFLTLYYFLHDLTYLVVAVVAIAASTADTWASEIGSLSKGKTYSILTFKAMEKGLSGAVSMLGVVASFLGALVISLMFSALYFLTEEFSLNLLTEFSVIITISGFFGSILDSYLGVFLQAKYKDIKSGKIAEMISNTEQFILISGKKFINNSTVNFIMVLTISVVTYLFLVI